MKRYDIILKPNDIILKRYDVILKRYDIILKRYYIILKRYDTVMFLLSDKSHNIGHTLKVKPFYSKDMRHICTYKNCFKIFKQLEIKINIIFLCISTFYFFYLINKFVSEINLHHA
jgi:hypothetical protein